MMLQSVLELSLKICFYLEESVCQEGSSFLSYGF